MTRAPSRGTGARLTKTAPCRRPGAAKRAAVPGSNKPRTKTGSTPPRTGAKANAARPAKDTRSPSPQGATNRTGLPAAGTANRAAIPGGAKNMPRTAAGANPPRVWNAAYTARPGVRPTGNRKGAGNGSGNEAGLAQTASVLPGAGIGACLPTPLADKSTSVRLTPDQLRQVEEAAARSTVEGWRKLAEFGDRYAAAAAEALSNPGSNKYAVANLALDLVKADPAKFQKAAEAHLKHYIEDIKANNEGGRSLCQAPPRLSRAIMTVWTRQAFPPWQIPLFSLPGQPRAPMAKAAASQTGTPQPGAMASIWRRIAGRHLPRQLSASITMKPGTDWL